VLKNRSILGVEAKKGGRPRKDEAMNEGGRPTKYKPEWEETLPDMFKDGARMRPNGNAICLIV
jgi:hypothetical protein